jgi:hypothetical protein
MPRVPLIVTITRPGRLAALFLSCCLASVTVSAMAQDDSGGDRKTGRDDIVHAPPNVLLGQEIAILKTNPDATSQDCLDAVSELHKTQGTLQAEQDRGKDQDVEVAQDVLEYDIETAVQACHADAAAICDKAGGSDPRLAKACPALDQGGGTN